MGFLAGRDADLLPTLQQTRSIWGFSASPFDCWLTLRSLPTLSLRMMQATANTVRLADWLPTLPGVARVIYPGRPDHPDHALAGRLYPQGAGNMLCVELAGGRDSVNEFMRRAGEAIPFSPSLGHHRTTCSYPDGTSHRYDSPASKARQGITPGLIRLSVGFEPFAEIEQAFRTALGAS
jgi:cystathionine beta-lyase/cystathionine gamma-synthase